MTAYKADKSITVYREGSREGILITDDKSSENKEQNSENAEMKTVATVHQLRKVKLDVCVLAMEHCM